MDKDQEEFGIETIAYDQLEKEFQGVLTSLYADQSLERFRVEYEKIHRALKSSHQQEKKLLSKCRELSRDILAGATRVQQALRFSNDDSQTISYLKSQLTKTYKFLELSRQHEETSKQNIEKRKLEMKRLQTILEQNQTLTEGQVATVHQYMATNEELSKEKEILQMSVQSNQSQLQGIKTKIEDAVGLLERMKLEYSDLLVLKSKEEGKVRQEEENKKRKKQDLQTIKAHFDVARTKENEAKENRKTLNVIYKEKLSELHHYEMNKEKERKRERKLNKEIDIEERKINELNQITEGLQELSDSKEKDLEIIQTQLLNEQEKAEGLTSQLKEVNDRIHRTKIQKEETEKLGEIITSGLSQLESEISNEKKNAQKDRSFIDKLKRDRDVYQKQIERADLNNKKLQEEFKATEKVIKEKENQISGQKKEVQRLNKMIMSLEKEKDSYAFQATSAEAKYFYSKDEVKLRDNFIAEFQKQHMQTEAKLKKQQALYESVRSDRNLVSKNLAQIQKDNEEYKRRYRMVNYQITQLNQEIVNKETELMNQHGQHKKKDKKIEEEVKKIEKFQKDVNEKESKIKNYNNDIKKLYAIIKENESEKQKLQEEYELVVAERDILGTQLIRRSAEADLLYEKIKINQSTLAKGQDQYRERLDEIDRKKEQIAELIKNIKNYKVQANSIADLKNELHTLSRELTESRLKVKALSEELQNPMNVHRWRKLEATDSLAYELMTKIQSIQKRLISKNDDVRRKGLEISDMDGELRNLEETLKRQPSIQQQKMIPVYEDALRQKHQQTKAMEQQINQYTQALEMDSIQMGALQSRLLKLKKKCYDQKKREQQTKDQQQKQAVIHVHLPDKRFTGGGFNLSG